MSIPLEYDKVRVGLLTVLWMGLFQLNAWHKIACNQYWVGEWIWRINDKEDWVWFPEIWESLEVDKDSWVRGEGVTSLFVPSVPRVPYHFSHFFYAIQKYLSWHRPPIAIKSWSQISWEWLQNPIRSLFVVKCPPEDMVKSLPHLLHCIRV